MQAQGAQKEQQVVVEDTTRPVQIGWNYPSKLLYALDCVEKTTLGPELVAAVIGPTKMKIARLFKSFTRGMWVFLLCMQVNTFVLEVLCGFELIPELVLQVVAMIMAATAAVYLFLLLFIYLPLGLLYRLVIMDLALFFPVSTLQGRFSNMFLKWTVTESELQYQVRLTDDSFIVHLLREQSAATGKIMLYTQAWTNKYGSMAQFLLECAVPGWWVWYGAWMLTGSILADMPVTDQGTEELVRFVRYTWGWKYLVLFVAWALIWLVLKCLAFLIYLLASLLNLMMCFLPGMAVEAATAHAKVRLQKAVSNRAHV